MTRFEPGINFNISSKTTSFWNQLKKKKIYIYIYISKLQHFNLNPKIITQLSLSHQSPNLSLSHKRLLLTSLFLSPHSLPLLLLLATTVLPLEATILGVPLFPLSHLLFSGSFIEDFEFYAPPYNAFIEVCLCTVLIYLLWIQFSFFFFFVIWNWIFFRERLWICLYLCVFHCFLSFLWNIWIFEWLWWGLGC